VAFRQALKLLAGFLRELAFGPFRELLHALERVMRGSARALLAVGLGLLLGWWLYVPAHELLHAFGCRIAGGEVSRLDIDPLYGAHWLSRLFPFVQPGGTYAGRLSGFDTRGSDWIYLATDLAPFVLTLLPGFWWLRRAARAGNPVAFGAALPMAFAPLVSLTGDAYEIGSLAVVNLPPWMGRRILVGDDIGAKWREISGLSAGAGAGEPGLLAGVVVAALLGLVWALVWMLLARRLAAGLGQLEIAPAVLSAGTIPRSG
jgi:hypothetical protein